MNTFQTYIQSATQLVKTAGTAVKALKGLGTTNPTSVLTSIFSSSAKPEFDLLKRAREYIPNMPQTGG